MAYLHEHLNQGYEPLEDNHANQDSTEFQNDPFDVEVPDTRDTGVVGLHYDNLFDQDEDNAGEIADQATMKRFDNSTSTPLTELRGFSSIKDVSELTQNPDPDMEDDEAARWLRDHTRQDKRAA